MTSLRRPTRVFILAAALALPACSPVVGSTGHHHVRTVGSETVRGPYAPAGQQFSVNLDQSIDTMMSLHHETFTARLSTPLRDQNGNVISPVGSVVRGHIDSLGNVWAPKVRLHFDTVETTSGVVPLEANLRAAQYQQYPVAVTGGYPGPYWGWYGAHYASPWPTGGGPGSYYYYNDGWELYPTVQVHLPANARIDLVLTRPMLVPGSVIPR